MIDDAVLPLFFRCFILTFTATLKVKPVMADTTPTLTLTPTTGSILPPHVSPCPSPPLTALPPSATTTTTAATSTTTLRHRRRHLDAASEGLIVRCDAMLCQQNFIVRTLKICIIVTFFFNF
jgi:hypothetical protein